MMPVMGVALIIVTTGIERGVFGDPTGFLANQMQTATCFSSHQLFCQSFPFQTKYGAHMYKKQEYKNKIIFLSSSSLLRMFLPLKINALNNKLVL